MKKKKKNRKQARKEENFKIQKDSIKSTDSIYIFHKILITA